MAHPFAASLFALLSAAIGWILKGRQGGAGAALGLAASLKMAALWAWPFLLLKGRGRTILWAAAASCRVRSGSWGRR